MRLSYHGYDREIEPYALAYKRRKDGVAREYFYAWDRVGGRSGRPGIKAFVNPDIDRLEMLEATFEPRFEIELCKAGEAPKRGYFQKSFDSSRSNRIPRRRSNVRGQSLAAFGSTVVYVIECPYCGKRFKRRTNSRRLNKHKTRDGWECRCRQGYLVDQTWS